MAALHANRPLAPSPIWPRWLAACALAALLAPCGDAAAQARPTRSALIVGVSNYAAPEVPALAGVPLDMDSARAMAAAMGIAPAQTTVLRDGQATKAAILNALDALADSMAEGSRVFIYFSGHGTRWYEPAVQGCKEGLLAYDRETLTNEEIARHTRRIGARADKVVVMFDACFSEGVSGRRTRALTPGLTAKFFRKDGVDTQACAQASNVATRSLLAESTRLGGLRENFVQITSSRPDEVSFDEPGKGGIATQAVRDCLLGRAADRDASGAVSMAEVEQCAQAIVDRKLRPYAELRPHHVSVSGNRNIVPVPAVAAPAPPQASPAPPTPATAPIAAPAPPPIAAPAPPPIAVPAPPPTAAPAPPPAAAPALASLATLRDIEAQRNPRRPVEVMLNRATLRVGKDALQLTVRPGHDGYLYLVLLGSDRKSFYLLFPNSLDRDNAVKADTRITLPRPGWDLVARGPAGTDHLLVLVSDTPRDLAALPASAPDPAMPFIRSLNHLPVRSALIDFFTGRGVTGSSEAFGARLLSIQEVD